MPLMAAAFPILPQKTADWRKFIDELNGPRHAEFMESRRRAGVQERTFLQSTPMGDLAVVTLEGDDPQKGFQQIVSATDPFSMWFLERVKDIHGVDLTKQDMKPPEQVIDSARPAVMAK